jgi:hypothetical protein
MGLGTLKEIVVYNGPIRPFDGLTIPLVKGTDVRSTIHHLCNGLNATQNECAMLLHLINPYIPNERFNNTSECAMKSIALFFNDSHRSELN